jgi:hypothetical protein
MTGLSVTKKPGEIDLVRLFEADAIELLSAVERGKILHSTKNIRESGAPLEVAFREFLRSKMPSVYRVLTGYLFDVDSKCTPQIDAMIISGEECHELMTSAEGASYVPFVGAHSVFEVKNTTYDVEASLDQISAVLKSMASMRSQIRRQSRTSAEVTQPLSVAFFAESSSSKLSDFQAWYAAHPPSDAPTYTFLLDKAVIIASCSNLVEMIADGGLAPVGFTDHTSMGNPYLCTPRIRTDCRRGRALLWLYLSIAHHLSRSTGDRGHIRVFTENAERTYALDRLAPLADVGDWNALNAV